MINNTEETILLEKLRTILLKQDRKDIHAIKETLNTPSELKKKVDPIFEENIELLKERFPEEFGAIINQQIEVKLEESKEQLLNVIYPVLGQMISKFINYQFQQLKDRIDEQVQNTFSSKGIIGQIKSRLFGLRSSDMVLSDLDKPQIQEVYVIQRDSGLLIGKYSKTDSTDEDMVAGMLTAIKSFAEDAFNQENQELDLIQYGSYKIWIQSFYKYYVAIALTGSLSAGERDDLNEHILEFAKEDMDINLQLITSDLKAQVSAKLEESFQKDIFK